ncbi:hypothetical protein EJ05DRAFT_474096 [Pseudovirgaria hyperparasitica]|uniref:Zn(2)-C6 fungal-type domain-containing protein n=1 Tax=Pseudovirgaria hyperparasitica TaxID=470096 RepID=A0A6A6WBJ4_9PEZI|nr:uncharacterized protein EJ05DRAFT_474096 [Pseudovirgaria hyperparasitica]KAF2760202.1 hypothetical protein EJ05DRAFT_474096 [Pseudovirgaria hyperparasitica]
MSLSLRTRKSRASAPTRRVKTGCKTCKCTISGRECNGYDVLKTCRHEFAEYATKYSISHVHAPERQVQSLGGGNNAHFLELYYHCVSKAISGPFNHDFWYCLSLQMAHAEPAVRHAIIALTCLYRSDSVRTKHARTGLQDTSEAQRQLLIHYNKSIRHLILRMSEASYSPDIGLATCILFICIEFFRGEYKTAFAHLMSGLKVISILSPTPPTDIPTIGAYHRALVTRNTKVDVRLASFFPRLITLALVYGAPVEHATYIAAPSPFKDAHPSIFRTLPEARLALHEVENIALFYERELQHNRSRGIEVPDADVEYNMRLLLDQHEHWMASFELFLTRIAGTTTPKDTVFVYLVRMAYWCTYISIANMLDQDMTGVDAYRRNFRPSYSVWALSLLHLGSWSQSRNVWNQAWPRSMDTARAQNTLQRISLSSSVSYLASISWRIDAVVLSPGAQQSTISLYLAFLARECGIRSSMRSSQGARYRLRRRRLMSAGGRLRGRGCGVRL